MIRSNNVAVWGIQLRSDNENSSLDSASVDGRRNVTPANSRLDEVQCMDHGLTVRFAVLVTPFQVAEIVTVVLAITGVVVIVNVGETFAPAATVTEAGTVELGSLLASVTTAPPDGAGPFSFTVFAVVDPPPITEAGDSVTAEMTAGVTVRFEVLVTPL